MAYNRIGFVRPRVAQWVKNKKFRAEINEQVIKGVRASGGDARIMPGGYALQVNEELVVASSIVRLARTKNGDKRWIFGYKTRRRPDILIVARMSEQANAVRDYFCLPYLTIGGNWFTFSDGKDSRVDPFQMTSLAPLCQILGRETISQKADASSPPQGSDPDDTLVCANELGVEESIAHLLRRLQVVFADPRLAKLMRSHEIGTLPRVLTRPEQDGRSSDHGRCVLHFTVLRSFMLRLAKQPEIAARLAQLWPTVFAELKLVYLAILTEAPRESLPYANRFGRAASMRTG